MDDLFEAANSIQPDEGRTTEPYARAIVAADLAFGIYPDPYRPGGIGVMVIRGVFVDCASVPEKWSAVFCAGADYAQALADTFGSVGIGGLTLAEASRRLNRLAKKSARDTRRRRKKMH